LLGRVEGLTCNEQHKKDFLIHITHNKDYYFKCLHLDDRF